MAKGPTPRSIPFGRRCRRPSLCRSRRSLRFRQLHRIAALQSLRRAVDYLIGGRKPGQHFDAVAEVSAELDDLEHCLVAIAKYRDLDPLAAWHECRGRDAHNARIDRQL